MGRDGQRAASEMQLHYKWCRDGFSLIELLLCLAVSLILIGLALPAIGAMYGRSQLTKDLAQVQQNAALISLYMQDAKEVYPRASDSAYICMHDWPQPLVEAGYLRTFRDADPGGVRLARDTRVFQSMAMTCEPELMRPNSGAVSTRLSSAPINLARVRFPSQKGWLLQICMRRDQPDTYFCCVPHKAPVLPLAMADSSAFTASRLAFIGGDLSSLEGLNDPMGMPILTTWHGVDGKDK